MKHIAKIRYYLELIAVPAFIFLVIHLAGHGIMLLTSAEKHHDHTELSWDHLFSLEVLFGILLMILFVGIWHLKPMKKLVPCSHDHCHHKHVGAHIAAIGAFVFHFFPESSLRYELVHDFDWQSLLSLAGGLAFFTHFLVDILIMVLLAGYWKKPWQRYLSFATIISFWSFAFWVGEKGGFELHGFSEGIILLISAFLLAMFVHTPHKPVIHCENCG